MIISADGEALEEYCSQLDREAEADWSADEEGDWDEDEEDEHEEDEVERKPHTGSKTARQSSPNQEHLRLIHIY